MRILWRDLTIDGKPVTWRDDLDSPDLLWRGGPVPEAVREAMKVRALRWRLYRSSTAPHKIKLMVSLEQKAWIDARGGSTYVRGLVQADLGVKSGEILQISDGPFGVALHVFLTSEQMTHLKKVGSRRIGPYLRYLVDTDRYYLSA